MTQALLGRNVVVTRPAGQATHLAEALVAAGAKPILFPVLAIFPLTDTTSLVEQIIRLDQYQLAIFISPNAVQMGLHEVLSRRSWPEHVRVATIGHSSEAALLAHDLSGQQHQILCPQGRFDSEALLELPELQRMHGRDVIIFRGDGGREHLAETLRQRGASVDYASCYRRAMPEQSADPLVKLWEAGRLDAITITSSEGLHNLVNMVGPLGLAWLRKTPLFVPHARIVAAAEHLGMQEVVLTEPADAGLMAGLLRYFGHEH
ncbi:MAG TPA: uroporphyrinogen-III synthase [Rhodocyclaceae bacterium]|jgi:uroporphyrinogen-III synthase|nr:uroporphyrinogen-III synthase [Rhodocyclaceae bacterium]